MLQLVLGRSGSGKTHYVYEAVAEAVRSGEERVLLLVPEQFSFESERALLRLLGARDAARVQVLSFTRLAETVARELGGGAGRRVDEVTRVLLMSRALESVSDTLTLYRRHTADASYVSSMLQAVQECKQYAVSPEQLAQTAETLPEGLLRGKVRELASIFGAYEALAANDYIDPLDALTQLSEQLPDSTLARDAVLFVDGFKGFTEQEMAVLDGLIRQTRRLTVSLTTDTLSEEGGRYALFAHVTRTANRLVRMARDHHVPIAAPVHLDEYPRTADPALRALEAGIFRPRATVYDQPAETVAVAPCADVYAECALVARTIRRLLRTEGLRCRDIAVVARNLSAYDGILDTALEKAGISYYMDRREDVLTEPLVTLIRSALRCAVGYGNSGELLQLLKTGLLGFSAHSIALLENYVYLWNIGGSGWRQTWHRNPAGLSAPSDEHTERQLYYLNLLRRRLMRPLTILETLRGQKVTGRQFAETVWRYLERTRVARLVRLQTARLDVLGEHAAADRMIALWELITGLLDKFGTVLGETLLPAERLTELFGLAITAADVTSIPQGLDAVQVGSAERMRFSAPRVVWILGANEGVFPAYPTPAGLFSDDERSRLAQSGLALSETSDLQAVEERFFAYMAVAAPSERLYVSYCRCTPSGEAGTPSALVEGICRLLPQVPALPPADDPLPVESMGDAWERLAADFRAPTTETATLRYYLSQKEQYRDRLEAMRRAAEGAPVAFTDKAVAADFFGDNMVLSASRVERYQQCRFAYFCEYSLKAKPRRAAEMDALESGLLVHAVLEQQLPIYHEMGFDGITRARADEDAAAAVDAYVTDTLGGAEDKPKRFVHQLERLKRLCGQLLWRVVCELRQSRFEPVAYELPVGMSGEGVDAPVLMLPDGARIRVIGKIDRVDAYRRGDETFLRVVDYKAGSKEFRLSDVAEGLNLQMLLYMFALWENGGARYGRVKPAGVLYLPAKLPVVKAERDKPSDESKQERERIRAMRMSGLLLDDPDIIRAMEPEAEGLFIPAAINAKGEYRRGAAVASLAQLGQLKKRTDTILREMAATLRAGDIAAVPVMGKTADACKYCPYHAVCGHEPDDPVRSILLREPQEIWRELADSET